MNHLLREMKKITNLLEKFDSKHMLINAYVTHDVNGLIHFLPIKYAGALKNTISAKCINKKSFDHKANLNIEFSCFESNSNHISIDKTKMLSHKILKIKIEFCDWFRAKDAYVTVVLPWIRNRERPITQSPDWTMCIPPDSDDANYKKYMKKYLQFCKDNPEFFRKKENKSC